ncbi:MAG: hypothetical protein M5R42_09500 [Rhodocyclaceae bacterium]|nr:hypothetical protein [Rhodocyclaceae bacterium]
MKRAKKPIIGFIFSNKGLMYNLTFEGLKITKLDKDYLSPPLSRGKGWGKSRGCRGIRLLNFSHFGLASRAAA